MSFVQLAVHIMVSRRRGCALVGLMEVEPKALAYWKEPEDYQSGVDCKYVKKPCREAQELKIEIDVPLRFDATTAHPGISPASTACWTVFSKATVIVV
jgi:hypothetical protein